ncbi:hypothetical protein [Altererythrobacter sp. Root672]|uniref:hypothetical protein n=1 Tax=Altererythrobacter sp. Root672 TaxID=1736584 RepID=UPI0006FA8818|nr:hypothetical protein [Altererythrobacter sp. Root672]KRA82747.1 hypothetical protein ASD76_01255 [Altererythrobacter sp. Root672]
MTEEANKSSGTRRVWAWGVLMAVFGFGAAQLYHVTRPSDSPVVYEEGSVILTPEVASVLVDPSRGSDGQRGVSAGQMFTTASGDRCRQFTQDYLTGVACLRDGDWRLVELRQADLPKVK